MRMELYDGAWCQLRNGTISGPAVPVKSYSGHQFLVGGLYYSVEGECQSGRDFDVVTCRAMPEDTSEKISLGAEIISIDNGERIPSRIAAAIEGVEPALLNGDADPVRTVTVTVATSFGLISAEVGFGASGAVSVSGQCLQIANGPMMPTSPRSLDRCGILRGDKWWTFREILVEAATREVAA